MYVKICGISSSGDLRAAIRAGASALGFLVGLDYPSEDELEPEAAATLVRQGTPLVSTVLVTHLAQTDAVEQICSIVQPSTLQLHGDFPLDRVPELRGRFPHLRIIKTVHAIGDHSIDQAKMAAEVADAILADTRTSARLGGTGQVHDWSVSRAMREAIGRTPFILAGGLDPENVKTAVEKVRPFAVDVNTGVSARRGVKDPELMRAFVERCKLA